MKRWVFGNCNGTASRGCRVDTEDGLEPGVRSNDGPYGFSNNKKRLRQLKEAAIVMYSKRVTQFVEMGQNLYTHMRR